MKRLLAGMVAAGTFAACGGMEMPGAPVDANAGTGCADVPRDVFAARCLNKGCHNANDKAGNLDLQSDDVAGRLRGKAASGGPGLLIDPAVPDKSALYAKLLAEPPFLARMPLGAKPLDDATIKCVRDWIAAQPPLPDMAMPDFAAPVMDLAVPPDYAMPDLKLPPDLAKPPDLAVVRDLAVMRDLVPPPDISMMKDLATPPDMSVAKDLAVPPDMSVAKDLASPPDLTPPKG